MVKNKKDAAIGILEVGVSLDGLVRRDAQQAIAQAIELDVAAVLEHYTNVRTLLGKQPIVRKGYLPDCVVVRTFGPTAVRIP